MGIYKKAPVHLLLSITLPTTTSTPKLEQTLQTFSTYHFYFYSKSHNPYNTAIMSGMMEKDKAKVDNVMHKDKSHGEYL